MIKFNNPGQINPISFCIMGAHAKPDTENPIGQFGSGLKYAVAIVLRLDGAITIKTNEETYRFKKESVSFRGKNLEQITCNGDKLGYTTDLGAHWEPWMAYRELYSNMKDEGGGIDADLNDWDEWTSVEIACPPIEKEIENNWKYFLNTPSIHENEFASIHQRVDHTGRIYYKNILVYETKWLPLNINIKGKAELTEDRTLKDTWPAEMGILTTLRKCDNKEIITQLIKTPNDGDFMESCYLGSDFNESTELVAQRMIDKDPTTVNPKIIDVLRKKEKLVYQEYDFNKEETKMLGDANQILECNLIPHDTKVVKTRNQNPQLIGFYSRDNNCIYLFDGAFSRGLQFLVTTLIEEHAHAMGHEDCSREFQDYLLDLAYKNLKQPDLKLDLQLAK